MWKKIVFSCFLFVILLSLGFIIGTLIFYDDNKIEKDNNETFLEEQSLIKETSSEESKIGVNTKICLSTYFDKCNHTDSEFINVSEEIINMKEEEAKEYFESKGYSLIKFDNNEILLKQKKNEMCQNHFVIKYENENDIFLDIYKIDSDDELVFYKETDVAREFLTSMDNQTFKEGIEVYGYENIEGVLEDYE